MALTVRALKDIIKDWPEVDDDGEPTEVWIETTIGLSSEAMSAGILNSRLDSAGRPYFDMLISAGE